MAGKSGSRLGSFVRSFFPKTDKNLQGKNKIGPKKKGKKRMTRKELLDSL